MHAVAVAYFPQAGIHVELFCVDGDTGVADLQKEKKTNSEWQKAQLEGKHLLTPRVVTSKCVVRVH